MNLSGAIKKLEITKDAMTVEGMVWPEHGRETRIAGDTTNTFNLTLFRVSDTPVNKKLAELWDIVERSVLPENDTGYFKTELESATFYNTAWVFACEGFHDTVHLNHFMDDVTGHHPSQSMHRMDLGADYVKSHIFDVLEENLYQNMHL